MNAKGIVFPTLSSKAAPIIAMLNIATTSTGQLCTDQIAHFPTPSSSGGTQLFVLSDYDSNSLHAALMASKAGSKMVNANKDIRNTLLHVIL
jgi:hypothetical protein